MKLDDYEILELLDKEDWLGAARLLLRKTNKVVPLEPDGIVIQTYVTGSTPEIQIHYGALEIFWRPYVGWGTCLAPAPDFTLTRIFIWAPAK
jgi:hypothetical protein